MDNEKINNQSVYIGIPGIDDYVDFMKQCETQKEYMINHASAKSIHKYEEIICWIYNNTKNYMHICNPSPIGNFTIINEEFYKFDMLYTKFDESCNHRICDFTLIIYCVSNDIKNTMYVCTGSVDEYRKPVKPESDRIHIMLSDDRIEFIEDSKFEFITKEEMYALYTFLNERLFGVKENIKVEEIIMSDVLITRGEVQEIINDSCKDIISACEQNGFWSMSFSKDYIGWSIKLDGYERMIHHICARLIGDAWYIWNESTNNGLKPNIEIYSDHVIFNKDSEFTDFSREFMYNLYRTFEEYISKKSIRCDSNEKIKDCDCKNDYKPFYETMTQVELKTLIEIYIMPRLNVFKDLNYTYHLCSEPAVDLYWSIYGHRRDYEIGIIKRDDHWAIYTNRYSKENLNVNIKIFGNNRVEFVDDAKFDDFDKEFMYGLYLKIKEFVEGNNIKEENING